MISLNKINQFEIYMKRYMILQKTGRGKRSVIFKAFDLKDEIIVALKIMDGHSHELSNNEDNISRIFGDCNFKDTNILQIYDVIFDQILNRHIIISEFVEEKLTEKLKKELNFEEQEDIMRQIGKGIYQLHDMNTHHNFLQIDKILIDKNNKIKICFHHLQLINKEYEWTSNAIIQKNNHFDNLKFFLLGLNIDYDMWAFGLIIYFMVFKEFPCNREQNNQFNFNEIEDIVTQKLISNSISNSKINDLLLGIFKFDSMQRLSWSQIFSILSVGSEAVQSITIHDHKHQIINKKNNQEQLERAFAAFKLIYDTQHSTGINLYNQTKTFERFISINFFIDLKSLQIDYDDILGQGGFGSVYSGKYQEREVAIKIMDVEFGEAQYLFDEILCNLLCKSDQLVEFFGINSSKKEQNVQLILVMEKMDIDLKKYIFSQNKNSKIDKDWKYKIIIQILNGINDLHEMNFVHCDLKLQNVLLTDKKFEKVKVADFGLSKALNQNNKTKKTQAIGMSERYASPEQLSSSAISTKCDIWAMGLMIYEILTQQIVWKGISSNQVIQKVLNQVPFFQFNDSVDNNGQIDQIILQCLKYDRTDRPRAKDLIKFFTQLLDSK